MGIDGEGEGGGIEGRDDHFCPHHSGAREGKQAAAISYWAHTL